ncbi:phosphoethanolamine transferase [Klebsiella pneumoniae]|uniref:Phosphoethanolamine transferase n=1 Tax=Klebsiella pneumoniae TaxID=573 RepID=A0A377XL13_KLEPN|nr:phosphoethanolamine transferase [Klebsiella pneumoniae]
MVFIIGETTRWDHMGILDYSRNTTPELEKEKNLVAFRGYLCDTATKTVVTLHVCARGRGGR